MKDAQPYDIIYVLAVLAARATCPKGCGIPIVVKHPIMPPVSLIRLCPKHSANQMLEGLIITHYVPHGDELRIQHTRLLDCLLYFTLSQPEHSHQNKSNHKIFTINQLASHAACKWNHLLFHGWHILCCAKINSKLIAFEVTLAGHRCRLSFLNKNSNKISRQYCLVFTALQIVMSLCHHPHKCFSTFYTIKGKLEAFVFGAKIIMFLFQYIVLSQAFDCISFRSLLIHCFNECTVYLYTRKSCVYRCA